MDMKEYWAMIREDRNNKKQDHAKEFMKAIESSGLHFRIKNGGDHVVINDRVDCWPTTGRWIIRTTKETGRGISSLLRRLLT